MAFLNTGLSNSGQTQFFKIWYDDSLPNASGLDVAQDLMTHCDSDFSWLRGWFPGVSPGTPITVNIASLSIPTNGGAGWIGWGPYPLTVTLAVGTFPVTGGDLLTLFRYFLIVETSEIFMRERQPAWFNRHNDWFEAFDEGSKGESLSHLFGVQFLREKIPQATMIPGFDSVGVQASEMWLNPPMGAAPGTPAPRNNHVDDNMDDISPDEVTGCGTLFLFFLHDQLGFGLDTIIAAGGATLADVYSHLTGDDRTNAFSTFADLVNLHYPSADGPYFPLLESVFPVPNLRGLLAPAQVSWVSNGHPAELQVVLDQVATVRTTIALTSDNPAIVGVPTKTTVPTGSGLTRLPLDIPLQGANFTATTATITADYAGKTLSCAVQVVRPEDLPLPALDIILKKAGDPCQEVFVEGRELLLAIKNISVFSNRQGLTYKWTVTGAAVATDFMPELSITNLPAAGTSVVVEVIVTNALKLHAKGRYEFVTTPQLSDLEELERLVMCRVRDLKQLNAHMHPWIPVENERLEEEHLVLIEKQSEVVAQAMQRVASSVKKLRIMRAEVSE
jgi:hypothetical protein